MGRLIPAEAVVLAEAERLLAWLRAHGKRVATAESCTGGLVAASLTALPGASAVVAGGFVTYSNELKQSLLGVSARLLRQHGAVSEAVAKAMAEGARKRAGTDFAVAVTGIAGPDGGSEAKPVGLVFIAVAGEAGTEARRYEFSGDRAEVRGASLRAALALLREVAEAAG